MKFKHILFPADFSDQCEQIIPSVTDMARFFGSELTLLHVIEPQYSWSGEVDSVTLEHWSGYEAEEKSKLEDLKRSCFGQLPVHAISIKGDPARVIARHAASAGIDLIMMPTHGYGPFRAALIGSVTAKVIHDTSCPIWTSAHTERLHNPPYPCRLIICAVDDLRSSITTIRFAGGLAESFESSLQLVHAIPQRDGCPERAVRARLEDLQKSAEVSVPISLAVGEIETIVTKAAKDEGADLLLIGRGHSPGVLGPLRSHVYSIIRNSPCPVITI